MSLLDSFFQLVASQFTHTSLAEWIGVIAGFICIYLATRQSILSWPVSIISVLAYALVFYRARMYGDMSLQFYFLFTAIYGWYYWVKRKESDDQPITQINLRGKITAILAVLVLTVVLTAFLADFTNTDVPLADGFCTAMSFVAQILLTRKILYNWILWIIVDICYVPLYIYKNLNLSAVFFTVLVALAIKGYFDWRKIYREQSH